MWAGHVARYVSWHVGCACELGRLGWVAGMAARAREGFCVGQEGGSWYAGDATG